MNHLIAKTKGKNGEFYKVISNKEIFELPNNLNNLIEYQTNYKLEEDEWFAIDKFSERIYYIHFLTKRFISTDYNQITVDNYNNIEYLCSYQSGVYYFQKLSTRQLIRKKYFTLSDAPILMESESIIIIDNFADAIYIKSTDILFFKNLAAISSIFKGIDTLYKEATKEETEKFLQNDFIMLDNDYNAEKVKKTNRKRIAMAMDTLKNYSSEERQSIFSYVREYCEDLGFDEKNAHFIISSEHDLKKLLFGIEQRYYTTRLGGERRLANSIITL